MRHHVPTARVGLTLLELGFVILLIGFMALLIVPRVISRTAEAREKTCAHNRTEINLAIERYFQINGDFPADINALLSPDYFPGGIPVCPVTQAPYALNATTHRVEGHTIGGSH